jgi:di/tripeptidase
VEPVVAPILIPDGTDGNSFRPKGAKTYGIFPGIVSQEIVSQMHGDTERVPLASVHEAAQILFETCAIRCQAREIDSSRLGR